MAKLPKQTFRDYATPEGGVMLTRDSMYHFGGCAQLQAGHTDGRPSVETGLIWPGICLAKCTRYSVMNRLSQGHLLGLITAAPTYRGLQFHVSCLPASTFGMTVRHGAVQISVVLFRGSAFVDTDGILVNMGGDTTRRAPIEWSAIATFDQRRPKEPDYVRADQCLEYGIQVLAPAVSRALLAA